MMENKLKELTEEQEQYLQAIMDNSDHLTEDQISELLDKYLKK